MTLYEILNMGGSVTFPWGYKLKGDIEDSYIDTYTIVAGEEHHDGLRELTKPGTALALADAMKWKELNKD